nr:hypothetical protein B0A51_15807 [Rachicladosporium sp. CCFEE 5018]
MISFATLALSIAPLAFAQSNEKVLGVYIFHRHGDRTAKSTPPANLTALGYEEVFTSGSYYRNRYIASDAAYKINGINSNLVKQSQIAVSAPDDTVLQNSAIGFLQGLYPPVGDSVSTETLRNGTEVTSPMQGYQLIPVDSVMSGSGSEDNGWLQSASGCGQAVASSNEYFYSQEYMDLLASTQSLYDTIAPVVNRTFTGSQVSFKNAYTIYDLINVATIHNASITDADALTPEVLYQLRTLADTHEWGLAYNASNDARAVTGMTLGGEIMDFLNSTLSSQGKQKLNIQFGAYGTFASFFGLAQLPAANAEFKGIADYASSMTFELFTDTSSVTAATYSTPEDLYVRFLWHNGTASNISEPTAYALFGSGQTVLPWSDFTAGMGNFSITSTEQWCGVCRNTTGTCAAYQPAASSGSQSSAVGQSNGNGMSPAVNGVIGAMVTLAVVLGVLGLVMLVGGYRLVSKKRMARSTNVGGAEEVKGA